MQCDYYAATINDSKNNVLGALEASLGGNVLPMKSGMHNYAEGYKIIASEEVVATVFAGGNNGANPHAFSSSDKAIQFRDVCRIEWADSHKVTRIDVCEDYQSPTLFDDMVLKLKEVATRKRVRVDTQGDWLSETNPFGRTMYLGSTKSPVRFRMYEKGKKHANELYTSRGLVTPEEFPTDWVRMEAQVRPQNAQRDVAAKSTLEDIWGFSKWLNEVGVLVHGVEMPRVNASVADRSSDEDKFMVLAKQYGRFLKRMSVELGGYEQLGLRIGEVLKMHDMMKRGKK